MKERYDFNFKSRKSRIIRGILFFYLALGVVFAVWAKTYFVLLLTGAIMVYWFVLAWPLTKLCSIGNFKKYPEKDTLITVTVNEEGFAVDSVESKGTFTWKAITESVETRQGFLLFKHPMYFSLFFEDFKSAQEVEWFRQMLRDKTVKFKEKC